MYDEDTAAEIKTTIVKHAEAVRQYAERTDGQLHDLKTRFAEIEKIDGRAALMRAGNPADGKADEATPEQKQAFERMIRNGDDAAFKAMSVGSDPDGGYLVGPVIAPAIYRAMANINPFRGLAMYVGLTRGDAFETPQDGGGIIAASWVGESETRPVTASPTLSNLRVPVNEIYCMPEVTQKLLDDSSFPAEQYLTDKIAEAFSAKAGDSYLNGDGSAKPRGFLTSPVATTADPTRTFGTVQVIPTGVSGAFASGVTQADVFVDTIASLKPQYRANAKWIMNRLTFAVVSKLKDTQGRFLLETNVSRGIPPSLLGYEVVTVEDMPAIGASSLSIGFGDWMKSYLIVERTDIRMLRDPFTNKPFVRFYTTMRTGGAVLDSTAFKLIRFSVS